MTKSIVTIALVALLSFSEPVFSSTRAASFEHRHRAREARRVVPLPRPSVSGVLPRALHGGDLLEMLNPAPPAEYGSAAESVSVDPDVAGQINGIKLLSVSF
jgi:hypothetical protein